MSAFTIQHNIEKFSERLSVYMALSRKTPDEVLEKKGKDLGIRLYQGFRARRWKGSRKVGTGVAWRELRARSRQGRGVKVRAMREPSEKAPETYLAYRRLRGAAGTVRRLLVRQKTSVWQKRVFAELQARQRGIGVLAASFLWFRYRANNARGRYLVQNKTKRVLGWVEKGEGYLRIAGETEGLARTDARYQVVNTAIAEASADMVPYIERKYAEIFGKAFGGAAA
jgi:hypothetical protein